MIISRPPTKRPLPTPLDYRFNTEVVKRRIVENGEDEHSFYSFEHINLLDTDDTHKQARRPRTSSATTLPISVAPLPPRPTPKASPRRDSQGDHLIRGMSIPGSWRPYHYNQYHNSKKDNDDSDLRRRAESILGYRIVEGPPLPPKPATYRAPDFRAILNESRALGRTIFESERPKGEGGIIRQLVRKRDLVRSHGGGSETACSAVSCRKGSVPSVTQTPTLTDLNVDRETRLLSVPASLTRPMHQSLSRAKEACTGSSNKENEHSCTSELIYNRGKFAQIRVRLAVDVLPEATRIGSASANMDGKTGIKTDLRLGRPRKSRTMPNKLPSNRYWKASQWTYKFVANERIRKESGEDVFVRFDVF